MVLGHDSALERYTRQGATWANDMNVSPTDQENRKERRSYQRGERGGSGVREKKEI